MADFILKYNAGVYQRKINTLEGYYSQLTSHLEQLRTLQGQMNEFWDGTSAEYVGTIGEMINKVQDRMTDCKNTCIQYQKITDELSNASSAVDTIVSDIQAATKQTSDAAGAAASIIGLIV